MRCDMLRNLPNLTAFLVALFIVLRTGVNTWAEAAPENAPKAGPMQKPSPEEKPDFPPFEEAMKHFEEVPTAEPPMIPLWYNKKSDALRAQIPAGLVGQKFLIATSMAGGPVATGFQLDHFLAYFERMDKSMVLMRVDPRYVQGEDEPIAEVIKRSYGSDEILRSIPIVTMKGGDPVIELDPILKGDFSGIGDWGGGSIAPPLSKWASFKAFPQNVELTADLAMMRGASGRRVLFHYSFSKIPESTQGYKPRAADDRVGYFLTVRKNWTKETSARTLFDRHINRWRLEKRDPSAELSAPKNPILWYIEKTVPLKYRRWVKEGILEWNKAFARCGFLDAIEVKQQEAYDRETRDLDPEDVRYNFFRWIVTGRAFAMGPSRDHPLTGQIFDADIVFDDSMVRAYVATYERLSGGADSPSQQEPILEAFFRAHPQWAYRSPVQRLLPDLRLRADPDDEFRRSLSAHMLRRGRPLCEFASGLAYQMQFAGVALEARGLAPDQDEFIGQIIKEIVMHEVGHCLGLRHNFKGSTWLSMSEIEEHRKAGEGNIGSVMDYNPPVVAPKGQRQGSFTTRSIGPYDYWAIEYGYRPAGAPYKDENEMLAKIASRAAEPGLDYATDEDTISIFSPDPYSNRYDIGEDAVDYATRQIRLTEKLLRKIEEWAVKDGESYSRLRRILTRIVEERARVCGYVARFVGGQVLNRDHKNDPDGRKQVEVISAKQQRAAREFVCKNVFAEDAYRIGPALLGRLAAGRYWHWDSDDFDFQVEFNVHDLVAAGQFQCLLTLMNPFAIHRIHDNQLRFAADEGVYTLAEHLVDLTKSIWSELEERDREGDAQTPFIHSFRRNLQRMQLGMLLNLVLSDPDGSVPPDANAIARYCLVQLAEKIESAVKDRTIETSSLAHLQDCRERIRRALEAQYALFSGSSLAGRFGLLRQEAPPSGEGPCVLPH